MNEETWRWEIDIPTDLWHWLVAQADANHRDLSSQIVELLKKLREDEEAAAGENPANP